MFTMSCFAKPLVDLIHVWHGDRKLSKILRGTIPISVHDLKVKVTELESYVNFIEYLFLPSF